MRTNRNAVIAAEKHPLAAVHYDPEDVGSAGGTQRNALIQALASIQRGAPLDKIIKLYGGYAMCRARLVWASLHLSRDELRSEAVAILQHELRVAPRAQSRIAAAKSLLEYDQRATEMSRRYDDETLGDSAQRQRAEEEFRRPSQLLQDLIVDVWVNEHPRPPIEPLLLRILRGSEDLIRSEGWIRIDEAHLYASASQPPVDTVVTSDSPDDAEFDELDRILESMAGTK